VEKHRLLELQFRFKLLARIPCADSLDGAFVCIFLRPDLMILRHIHLGKAEFALGVGRVASN